MSPPLWLVSIPVGFAYTFFPRILSLVLQIKSGVPLQNAHPRDQPGSKEVAMKDTDGYVRRAYAAHQNCWEAMILWTAAVMVAKAMDVDEDKMNCSAAVWMLSRAVYVPAYTFIRTHKASFFRTSVFTVGMVTSFHLMYEAVKKA